MLTRTPFLTHLLCQHEAITRSILEACVERIELMGGVPHSTLPAAALLKHQE